MPDTPPTASDHSSPFHGPFGGGGFGQAAERFARFFGTPRFIIGQTIVVVLWLIFNSAELLFKPFDVYPFILLNLAFSTQAAYAAPLILLAQTRQADRDKLREEAFAKHREAEAAHEASVEAYQTLTLEQDKALAEQHVKLAEQHVKLLEQNTALTEQVAGLVKELHGTVCRPAG